MCETMNEFYVYVYLDPRKPGDYNYSGLSFDYEPFYVGKGKGNRLFIHLSEKYAYNSYKINKINKIRSAHLEPIVIKYFTEMSEQEAFLKETDLIFKIGRNPFGPLTNMSDGGEGQSGYRHQECTKKKISEGVKNSEKYNSTMINVNYRKKLSEALKGHIGWNKGGSRSEEDILKIKEGKKKSNKKGFIKHTEESKNKMSQQRVGLKNANSTLYTILTPDCASLQFEGRENLKNYIINTNASFSSLIKNGNSKGYSIKEKQKLNKRTDD